MNQLTYAKLTLLLGLLNKSSKSISVFNHVLICPYTHANNIEIIGLTLNLVGSLQHKYAYMNRITMDIFNTTTNKLIINLDDALGLIMGGTTHHMDIYHMFTNEFDNSSYPC